MSDLTTDGIGTLRAPRLLLSDRWFALGLPALDILLSMAAGIAADQVSLVGRGDAHLAGLALIGCCAGLIYVIGQRMRGAYLLPALVGQAERWRHSLALALSCDGLALMIVNGMGSPFLSRGAVAFALLQIASLAASRSAGRAAASALVRRDLIAGPPVILVGDADDIDGIDRSSLLASHGYTVVGRIGIGKTARPQDSFLDAVLALSRRCLAERIVVAMGKDRLEQLRGGLRRSALPVTLLRRTEVGAAERDHASGGIGRWDAVELQSGAISSAILRLKRGLDVGLAATILLLLSPLLLLTAILVKLDSPGPAIFRQRRHGFDRRPFFIYKFRSMRVAEDGPRVTQARRGDARVTRVGRIIRRSSIDELPQLINVLKGDMSLVGPRPHAVAHDDAYTAVVERYALRHHVKPGLTGWAQINGARGETAAVHQMQRRIDLDLWYIDHFSLWLDLAILCRTCLELAKNDAF